MPDVVTVMGVSGEHTRESCSAQKKAGFVGMGISKMG
jgi:hypothetical protein